MGDTAAQHGSAGEVNPTAAAVRLSLTVLAAAGTAAAAAVRGKAAVFPPGGLARRPVAGVVVA